MGLPNPQYDVDLIDHDGRSVEAGEQGQIVIRTDKGKPLGLFKGILPRRQPHREAWHDNIYYTGDVAWKDEDGPLVCRPRRRRYQEQRLPHRPVRSGKRPDDASRSYRMCHHRSSR